jgi:competence protein ComGC
VSSILVLPHLSLLVVVNITTQNKDFKKGHIEVYRALVDELLQFHQLKRNSNHFDIFYLNA